MVSLCLFIEARLERRGAAFVGFIAAARETLVSFCSFIEARLERREATFVGFTPRHGTGFSDYDIAFKRGSAYFLPCEWRTAPPAMQFNTKEQSMNRIGLVGKLVLLAGVSLLAVSGHAQQRYDPAIPKGMSEQPIAPAVEPIQSAPAPIPPRLVQNAQRAQRDADARNCLTLSTNKEVHRCSLRYRSQAARAAAVRKASTKPAATPPAAASIEFSRPAEVVKPGPVRPADAAKAADLVKPMDVTKGGTAKAADTTAKAPEPAKPAAAPPAVPPPAATAPPKSAEPAKK